MKTLLYRSYRLSTPVLGLVALANWLLVAALFGAFVLAAAPAAAQAPKCRGNDMLAALERDNPSLAATLRAEAAKTPFGKGLLWRVEADSVAPSYIFGTMHMTDPRVVTLPPAAQAAFDSSSLVVIETTDVLDETKMAAAIMKRPDLMLFTDGGTLSALIPDEDRAAVSDGLSKRGIALASVENMKPWIISALVSVPACEMARKAGGAQVLDIKLANDAKASGKDVAGLETVESQLEAMASLPMAVHVEGLVETLKLGDQLDDVMETMLQLYVDGETGLFWPFFRAALPDSGGDDAAYAEFQETMVSSRNHGMVEHAMPLIMKGGAFIAMGALHLPGPEGVAALLESKGLTVTAVE